ncbi:unnamed protein product [Penicillium egyptiacum]|uniref:NB-ARC domain-containing protein n=1 Tax=Penicillium egyptiacum TaxID=1303716 RepID=A0A9W4KID8_9EURO|nr:unnamed protein product [Penicillium egyptiacum]
MWVYCIADGVLDSIVAVHGLGKNSIETWTHHETGTLWLRDLLPQSIHNARVLTFDYDANPSLYTGKDFMDRVQSQATTLVADLEGERSLENASRRPVIFVCHGLGGIIVKSALVHSASRTSHFTSHLNAIYISTFAILFFSTPHDHIDVGKWLPSSASTMTIRQPKEKISVPGTPITVHTLEVITNQFAPLMKKIHMYLFWEGVRTQLARGAEFMVDPSSAAPYIYDTERCGISSSNHSDMTKFHQSDSAYRTVISALMKYCYSAPAIVTYRWREAMELIMRMRRNEACELTGLFLEIPDKVPITTESKTDTIDVALQNEHFHLPCTVSMDFIGQEDIMERLQNAFEPEDLTSFNKQQKRFVVYGIGGSGKTQISAKYAQNNRQQYWAIFTIDASSTQTAKESFCRIGRMGGLEATEDSGKHFLSQARKNWLLIIDNADKPDIKFENLIVPGERGHILVTTRNPSLRRQGNVGSVEVKGLKQREALHLLMKVADILPPWDLSSETAANEIIKTLGYLALAVIQAGNLIYNKMCNLKEYLRFYRRFLENRQRRKSISNSEDPAGGKTENDDIYSAFDFSFQNIVSNNTTASQDAVEILNIVSFYHFDNIRVDIFERGMSLERSQLRRFRTRSLRAEFVQAIVSRFRPPRALPRILKQSADDMHPLCIREALRELYASSLITYGHDEQSFSLHPLVHAWARDRIPPKERSLWAIISFHTLMASVPLPPMDTEESQTSFRRSLIPHLNECLEACPAEFREFSGLDIGKYRRFTLLFQPSLVFTIREMIQNAAKCGILHAETGDFSKSAYYLFLAKESLVKFLGPNDAKTTATMLGLASILWGLGHLKEAIALQEKVVESRQRVLGPDHRETLLAMDSLGQSFWLNGQYCEALELQQQTAEKMQRHLGEGDDDTLKALDHLGVTLNAWHRVRESRDIHQKVLKIRIQNLEESDLRVLETKNNLAMALFDLRELDDAISLMEEVYNGRKAQMGKEHPYTLWALCYLAKIYTEAGELQKAEGILIEGIAAGKRSLGENHLGVLVGYGELARTYSRQDRLDEAVTLLTTTIDKIKVSRGSEHPDYATGMWSLGLLWEKKQEQSKAMNAYQVALEVTEKRLTAEHPLYKIISDRIILLTESSHGNDCQEAIENDSVTNGVGHMQIKPLHTIQTW